MGYTHYWTQERNFTIAEWKVICEDVDAILKEAMGNQGIALANGMGDAGTSPLVTTREIRFNGVGEDSHETFMIRRTIKTKPDYPGEENLAWDFCKTARKAYDPVVVAVLCYLSTITRENDPKGEPIIGSEAFSVSSDGNLSEWLPGLDLARKALPRVANQLDLPMEMLKDARWCGPWVNCKSKLYEVHFCVDGKGYVLHGDESYCFESHRALAIFLDQTKHASFRKGGGETHWGGRYGREEPDIWRASGSFDEERHARIAKAQRKVLAKLFPVDPSCAQRPPAYVRPGEMPDNAGRKFCYSVNDLLNLVAE